MKYFKSLGSCVIKHSIYCIHFYLFYIQITGFKIPICRVDLAVNSAVKTTIFASGM